MSKAKAWKGVAPNTSPRKQAQLEKMVEGLANAYEVGRYELPPDELLRQLSEYAGSEDLDFIVSLLGWEGNSIFTADLTQEREYAIRQSEHAWRHNPLYQWSVWSWTNQGVGESVQVTPTDESAREPFAEFWDADRNAAILGQDNIHAFSEWLLVTGDRYIVHYADTSDGEDTIRSISPSEFPGPPITDPNDKTVPLFYKRQWMSDGKQKVLYYPDWNAFFNYPEKLDQKGLLPDGAKRADEVQGETVTIDGEARGTVAVIQHIAHNQKNENDLRGWPLGTISGPYQEAHKRFMEDRLAVAAGKAMYVRRKSVKAGSRGLASIASTLQSSLSSSGYTDANPPAPAASNELDNAAVKTTDLPMTTGASDAVNDNKMFAWMGLLGDGLFPTSAGLDTSRYATALTMDKNQAMLWSRYKSFIAQQFKDMVRIVLLFLEKYGGASYSDKTATVIIDTLSIVDFPPVVTALSEMFERALTPLVEAGIMPMEIAQGIAAAAWGILLQSLGVENAGDLAGDFSGGDEGDTDSSAVDEAIEHAAKEIAEAARKIGEGAR